MLQVTHRTPGPLQRGCLHSVAVLRDEDRAVLAYESAGTVAVVTLQASGASSAPHVLQTPPNSRASDVTCLAWAPDASCIAVAAQGRVDCFSWRGGSPGANGALLSHDGCCDTQDRAPTGRLLSAPAVMCYALASPTPFN